MYRFKVSNIFSQACDLFKKTWMAIFALSFMNESVKYIFIGTSSGSMVFLRLGIFILISLIVSVFCYSDILNKLYNGSRVVIPSLKTLKNLLLFSLIVGLVASILGISIVAPIVLLVSSGSVATFKMGLHCLYVLGVLAFIVRYFLFFQMICIALFEGFSIFESKEIATDLESKVSMNHKMVYGLVYTVISALTLALRFVLKTSMLDYFVVLMFTGAATMFFSVCCTVVIYKQLEESN